MSTHTSVGGLLCPVMLLVACALTTYVHLEKTHWQSELTAWAHQHDRAQTESGALFPWSIEKQQLNLNKQQPSFRRATDEVRRAIGQSLLHMIADHGLQGDCTLSRIHRDQPMVLHCNTPQATQALNILPVILLKNVPTFAYLQHVSIRFSPYRVQTDNIRFF